MLPAGAKALATAVLEGDETAVLGLIDYVNENRRHPPYDIGVYCDRLEDALREIKQILRKSQPFYSSVDIDVQGRLIPTLDVNRIYTTCFILEREAKAYKRNGPA